MNLYMHLCAVVDREVICNGKTVPYLPIMQMKHCPLSTAENDFLVLTRHPAKRGKGHVGHAVHGRDTPAHRFVDASMDVLTHACGLSSWASTNK